MKNKNLKRLFLNNFYILILTIVACANLEEHKKNLPVELYKDSEQDNLVFNSGEVKFYQTKFGIKIVNKQNVKYVNDRFLDKIVSDMWVKTEENKVAKQKGILKDTNIVLLAFNLKNGYNKAFLFDNGEYQTHYKFEPSGMFFCNNVKKSLFFYTKPISINLNAYDDLDSLRIFRLNLSNKSIDSLVVTTKQFNIIVKENSLESDLDVLSILNDYELFFK